MAGGSTTNEFHGNDFRGASLIDTCFVGGIDLDAQLLPETREYVRVNDARKRINAARPQIETWDEGVARREATATLNTLEFLARGDQRDLFVRRDFLELPQDLSDTFWELLGVSQRE